MKLPKQLLGTIGLLLITVLSAIQYAFLDNVPSTVSTFSFMFITYAVGFVILAGVQPKKLKKLNKKTLAKGALLAGELLGFNFFMIMGSRGIDSVVISSVLSMYFIFIPPILLLMKRRVNFRAAVASSVAVIALLLMFKADISSIFSSPNVLFLLISNVFFAFYVVTISVAGEDEDPTTLTVAQMIFSIIFSFAGWGMEIMMGASSFSFPTDKMFWLSVLFFGVCIRALYSIVQMASQKHVPPASASLIIASEIIITLITAPFMARILHTEAPAKATVFQVIGCFLFVIAVLIMDDMVMRKLGYRDMDIRKYTDANGKERMQQPLSRKITNLALFSGTVVLVLTTIVCIGSILSIKSNAVTKSKELGNTAADASESALSEELVTQLKIKVNAKADITGEKLNDYLSSASYITDYINNIYTNPYSFPSRPVNIPDASNEGKWVMQRALSNDALTIDDVKEENNLLGNLENVLDSVVKDNRYIEAIYFGTRTGLFVSYDANSANADSGVENYYDFSESDWYKQGKDIKDPFFTNPYYDEYGRGLVITCISPAFDDYNNFIGVLGMDILIDDLNDSVVNDNISAPEYAILFDNEGFIIAGGNGDTSSDDSANILDPAYDSELKEIGERLIKEENVAEKFEIEKDSYYVCNATIEETDWILCIVSPVSTIIKPAVDIRNDITSNTRIVANSVNENIIRIINICLVMFAVIILLITYYSGKFSVKISKPLQDLEKDVLRISEGNFDRRTRVSTDDEIGSLARRFNIMAESLDQHIKDLKEMSAKEERIASELALATDIQANSLPTNFDEFKAGKPVDISAFLTPAKEVGGDFYDFFDVDDDHIAIVIADVSGKGVPASLFMMAAKTLLKSAGQMGLSPKAALETVNNQLCENNQAEMFVTVWMGILELSSGKLICANAGHEYPAIYRKDTGFEYFKDKHGFVLAGMPGLKYKEYEILLNKGDKIFLYTDGVTEATDASNQLYEMENLINSLNRFKEKSCQELLPEIKKDIDSFVGDAPQFDDITMLCLEYKGV